MEEGVATESRGGSKPEVTGVGWSLPCSLSSLLAMNCRARAEGLARRLQAKVRLGNGGTSSFEQTSLVNPGPDDHYASMECRHSSLDDPHLDLLEGSSLRPIHVVTSEPTLHLCHPPQPDLVHLHEQDSDVYYDFDLASPDEGVDAEEEEMVEVAATGHSQQNNEEQRRQSEGERPESGCVTSVTSPVMFEDEREDDDDESEEVVVTGADHPADESMACSPDADLRAVRQILSYSSLNDAQSLESGNSGSCMMNGECVSLGECGGGGGGGECEFVQQNGLVGHSGTEGAECPINTCPRHPMWMTSSVAKSGSCWCHHAPGTPPAVPRTSAGRLACYASPPTYCHTGRSNGRPCWGLQGGEVCSVKACVMIDNEGHNKDEQGHENNTRPLARENGHPTRTVATSRLEPSSPEGEVTNTKDNEEAEAIRFTEKEDALKCSQQSGSALEAISGSSPPPPAQPHLYPTSGEEHLAVMEARDDEADLPPKGEEDGEEEVNLEDDHDVIETLDEDEQGSEEEANEEDIEEETILTGKFRNIRGYKERVRRLSDEAEDRAPLVSVITYDDQSLPEQEEVVAEQAMAAVEEPVSGSELASQLSELQVEDVGIQVDTGEEVEGSSDDAGTRSSSEETDPERIEEYKMRVKRSSSLKCGKTPPGTPGRKKIVRFADVLGLDLAAVRTFLGGGVPHVPRSAFWDLQVEEKKCSGRNAASAAAIALVERQSRVPRRVLTPLFQQPGLHGNFLERVRTQRVVVESVDVGDDMSVRGIIRVLNLDYHKTVLVRYTFDQWRNYHEATATYIPGSYDGLTDQFSFLLWGSFLQDNGALVFCVRYETLGEQFWDNNFGRNYSLQCYTTSGHHGEGGTAVASRPQNSSMVQQHFEGGGTSRGYQPFVGSPTTHHDPWITKFF